MSIIHDALKKTGERLPLPETPNKKKNTLLTVGIAVIFVGFIGSGVAVAILFSALKTPTTQNALQKKTEKTNIIKSALSLLSGRSKVGSVSARAARTQKNSSLSGWDLQGIMDMDGEKVALINDEIFKAGDKLDGERVMQITQNTVEISSLDKSVVLKLK